MRPAVAGEGRTMPKHLVVHRPTLLTAAVLSIGALGVAGCGSSSSSSSSTSAAPSPTVAATTSTAAPAATTTPSTSGATVASTLTEFAIATTPATVPAGRVTFKVTNNGKVKHQFTVISTTKSAGTVLSAQKPNDDIAGARGEIATIAPGASKTLVIKNLKSGHYALVCALPGHYQAGMHEDFTVQ